MQSNAYIIHYCNRKKMYAFLVLMYVKGYKMNSSFRSMGPDFHAWES